MVSPYSNESSSIKLAICGWTQAFFARHQLGLPASRSAPPPPAHTLWWAAERSGGWWSDGSKRPICGAKGVRNFVKQTAGRERVKSNLVGGPGPPLWKIWVRHLGWWDSQYMQNKIHGNQTTNQKWMWMNVNDKFDPSDVLKKKLRLGRRAGEQDQADTGIPSTWCFTPVQWPCGPRFWLIRSIPMRQRHHFSFWLRLCFALLRLLFFSLRLKWMKNAQDK